MNRILSLAAALVLASSAVALADVQMVVIWRGPAAEQPECSSGRNGYVYWITDATNATDCDATGGGNSSARCVCSAGAWTAEPVAGPAGAQGPAGPAGSTGATGAQGSQGPQGPTGPQGIQGETGATGPQGIQGAQGIQGPQGPQGDAGTAGAAGATGPAGPTCVTHVLWSACSPTGVTSCTVSGIGCVATTNMTAVGQKGATVAVDFDTFTHCRLRYSGALAASQSGAVTVKLRSYAGAGADLITTTFNSGTTCADRSSAVTDLTAQTGLQFVGAQIGESVTTDDPLLSAVTLTCCGATFAW
jgi:hypothetical protein